VLGYVSMSEEANIKLATRVGEYPPFWMDRSWLFKKDKTDLAWVGKISGKS
jgi:hypothetical protein